MRWVTYFPKIERLHLTKDVGLIPYYASLKGYDAILLGHVESEFDLPEEVADLRLEKLKDQRKWFFLDRAFLQWLKQNAAEVEVLHLFHLSRDTLFYGAYYKRLNPQGKLYLKMDVYNDHLRNRKRYSRNGLKNFLIQKVEKRFFHGLDLATAENREGVDLVKETYPQIASKIAYLPNGCHDQYIDTRFDSKKEKIILSVGRPGSPDKNYELLLAALPKANLVDWKVVVIGPISDEFQQKLKAFFDENRDLKEKVEFPGAEYDREALYHQFARASVFVLPSRFESFGIALIEALYFGACLVGHRGMYAYADICREGDFGTFFKSEDAESLARAIEEAMIESQSPGFAKMAADYCRKKFVWSTLSEELFAKLDHD